MSQTTSTTTATTASPLRSVKRSESVSTTTSISTTTSSTMDHHYHHIQQRDEDESPTINNSNSTNKRYTLVEAMTMFSATTTAAIRSSSSSVVDSVGDSSPLSRSTSSTTTEGSTTSLLQHHIHELLSVVTCSPSRCPPALQEHSAFRALLNCFGIPLYLYPLVTEFPWLHHHDPLLLVQEQQVGGQSQQQPPSSTSSSSRFEARLADAKQQVRSGGAVQLFFGNLPFEFTEVQVAFIVKAASGVSILCAEPVPDTRRRDHKSGCALVYVSKPAEYTVIAGLHQRVLVDDLGVFIARTEEEMKQLFYVCMMFRKFSAIFIKNRPHQAVTVAPASSSPNRLPRDYYLPLCKCSACQEIKRCCGEGNYAFLESYSFPSGSSSGSIHKLAHSSIDLFNALTIDTHRQHSQSMTDESVWSGTTSAQAIAQRHFTDPAILERFLGPYDRVYSCASAQQ